MNRIKAAVRPHIDNFMKYRFLLKELVNKNIKLQYRNSVLGIFWTFLQPLLTMIVLSFVFMNVFGRGNSKTGNYPVYLLCGRLLFQFYTTATKRAMTSIRRQSSMIKKVYVPKYFYPLSSILFNFIIYLISLLVLIPVSIYARVAPTGRVWHLVPAVIYLLILTIGVGMILSTLNVFFRDIEYLWNVALLIIMYMSAIFYYPERLLNSGWYWILKYNPLFCIIDLARSGVLGYAADLWTFLYPLIFGLTAVGIGIIFFHRKQDEFILHI